MSIGTVNSVWVAAGDRDQPAVRVRRTAVTFDSAGGARMGTLPRFAPVITDFADLTRYTEPVVVNGRIWTQADLVAAVIACLLAIDEPAAGPVATYPAVYSDRRLSPLRHALERAGATDVTLMPEAVAAVEWLDAEHGVSENGLTLVYDLGGNTLDVAVVRTEGDRDKRGVLGKPMRSHEYGGRPLGTVLARYARALAPGAPPPVSQVVPLDDTTRLRTWTVRNSLRLVRKCVYAAGLTLGDIDRVLLVGGAARPPEVARVLSELGRPLVMSQDPAHTVAIGAALAAARMADPGMQLGRYARGAAAISGAAVASAVAMSAASMLGSAPLGTDGPALEFAPALAGPAGNQFRGGRVFQALDGDVAWSPGAAAPAWSARADGLLSPTAALRVKGASAQSMSAGPNSASTADRTVRDRGTHCVPTDRPVVTTYANPARFTNPLPFTSPTIGPVSAIPSISLPGNPSGATPRPATGAPSPHLPGTSLPNPSDTSGTPISDHLGHAPGAGPDGSPGTSTGGAGSDGAGTGSPGKGSGAGQTNPVDSGIGPDTGQGGASSGTGPDGANGGAGSGGANGGAGSGGASGGVGSGGSGVGSGQGGGGSGGGADGARGGSSQGGGGISGGGVSGGASDVGSSSGGGTSGGTSASGGGPSHGGAAGGHSSNTGTTGGGSMSSGRSGGTSGSSTAGTSRGSRSDSMPGGSSSRGSSSGGSHGSIGGGGAGGGSRR
ncbi:Hsp70 family protein [Nocardia wallacei]|uniref:Hsp70 family protein n=1 Tax=Nocardia wallacei TaxID=480035 RepID=UPI00245638FF|nr:Hsp70 family protein [Nocardia wallacei]